MTALLYLIMKSVKNALKEILKKPGKLALYLLVLVAIVGMVVISFVAKPAVQDQVPMFWFTSILFLFITIFTVTAVVKGVSNGDAIFDMNDVNLLFVSPISPRKILLYGVLRLAKVSFFAGFFVLFQASSLARFGIHYGGVLLILLGIMLSVTVLSIVSLLIYSATNGNEKKKRMAKAVAFGFYVPLMAYSLIRLLGGGEMALMLENILQSPFLTYIPVAGWTAAGITALLSGELTKGLLFLSANVALCGGLIAYILHTNVDYYEDTLVATETAFEKKRAIAQGDINPAQNPNRPVKLAKMGIGGIGASTLFYKHIREGFRQNRFGFLSAISLWTILGAVAVSLVSKDLVTVLQILMWMQIFLIGTGRGLKETYSHYIYLIPESSFQKILWSNMEVMARTLLESLLIFIIPGLIIGANPLIIAGCIATYTLFSLLLLGVNYLFMRFLRADISAGLLIMIYYLSVILAIAPGLTLALIVGFGIGGTAGTFAGLLILAAWELIGGCGCLALARGVLNRCDIQVPTTKR